MEFRPKSMFGVLPYFNEQAIIVSAINEMGTGFFLLEPIKYIPELARLPQPKGIIRLSPTLINKEKRYWKAIESFENVKKKLERLGV